MKPLSSVLRKFLAAGALATALISNQVAADSVLAAPSDSFVEFMGLQGHLDRGGAIWEKNAATWRARVGELGIRYMRTSVGTSHRARDNALILFKDYGVRLNVVVEPKKADGSLNPTQIRPYLDFLKEQIGTEKISSIEGPNEYSQTKYSGNDDWVTELRTFQSRLYELVKADSRSIHLPVIAPTIWRRIEADYNQLGALGKAADNGNLHYYNGGRKPSVYNRERFYGDEGVETPMNKAIQNAQITIPGKPIFVTETGYNIRVGSQSAYYVPEPTAAKYMLRLVSEFFLRGSEVRKAYIYSLVDSTSERQFGLLRSDLSRRPAFYAIKNAIRILSDKGPAFSPGALTYNLSGDLSGIHHAVLQKRDKRFYLVVWNDAVSWDRMLLVEVNPPVRDLTLDISQHNFKALKLYLPTALGLADPNRGALPIQTINSPHSVVLRVPDHVLIAEMLP